MRWRAETSAVRTECPSTAGIDKETEGVTLASTRHSAPQFPLHPYRFSTPEAHGGPGPVGSAVFAGTARASRLPMDGDFYNP
jgi:hypothetical protein